MFSKRAVASAEELLNGHVRDLCALFAEKLGQDEPLDLQTAFLAYTTDATYHFIFDMDQGYLRNPWAAQDWRRSMRAVAQATPFCKQFPWLNAKLLKLPAWFLDSLLGRLQPDLARLLTIHKVGYILQCCAIMEKH
jgi:hypothetical protein